LIWNKVDEIVSCGIEKAVYPGAVVVVGKDTEILYEKPYGFLAVDDNTPVTLETVYDIASMSKVVATTSAIMLLVSRGDLSLWDTLGDLLDVPESKKGISVFHLLTHTSGMQPYSEAWRDLEGRELLESIISLEPENGLMEKINYSCLNFITLMAVVEKTTSMSFAEFCSEEVFRPLGMNSSGFLPKELSNVAPTCKRDGKVLKGLPDDELAYYLGGVSGNAGVFSTGRDLFRFVSSLMCAGLVPSRVFETFVSETVCIGGDRRHLGWLAPSRGSSAGDILGEDAFGHTGFTGTSLWVDPVTGLYVILLSNRTNISRRDTIPQMQRIRRRLHNLVFGSLG
jgi:CubicO group peptidase (beta-lactamase class C family)